MADPVTTALAAARAAAESCGGDTDAWTCHTVVSLGNQLMAPRYDASGRFHGPGSIEAIERYGCNNLVVPRRCLACNTIEPSANCVQHTPEQGTVLQGGGWMDHFCEECRRAANNGNPPPGDDDAAVALFDPPARP